MMMAKNAAKMFSLHDKNTADINDDDIDDIDRTHSQMLGKIEYTLPAKF